MKQYVINVPENIPVAALVDFVDSAVELYADYLYYIDEHKFGEDVAHKNAEVNHEYASIVHDATFGNKEWATADSLKIKFYEEKTTLESEKKDCLERYDRFLTIKKALVEMAEEYEHLANQQKEKYQELNQ